MPGILGRKLGMTRVIEDDGRVIPLTVVLCSPNEVTQVKTTAKDGYPALVLGFDKVKKPTKNRHFYFKKEFSVTDENAYKKGDQIKVDMFATGEKVRITGISKGKGFQGVIKRFHFAGGPASHGSHSHREPGSIGARAKPGKVHKGKKLPGHMGCETKTVWTEILYVNPEKHLVGLKGPVPGANKSLIIIRKNA